jgi:hypothetical protein
LEITKKKMQMNDLMSDINFFSFYRRFYLKLVLKQMCRKIISTNFGLFFSHSFFPFN